MVASACGHDAALALDSGQRANEIQAAANLEGARRIVILVLDPDVEPRFVCKERVTKEWCRSNHVRDAGSRFVYMLDSRRLHELDTLSGIDGAMTTIRCEKASSMTV